MSDLFKYLNTYGDYSFIELPLNEVDIALFTKLTYIKFENFKLIENKEYNFLEFLNKKNNINRLSTLKKINLKKEDEIVKANLTLLSLIRYKKRYKEVYFSDFKIIKDYEKEEQFASILFLIKNINLALVSFRGTDSSLVGWKEDFNLSYKRCIPSEIDALNYLKDMIKKYKKEYSFYVIGHSKGGNLAVYSSSLVGSLLQTHIKRIYDFDGPGNLSYFYKKEGYQNILNRIFKFVPESSIIGRLLEYKFIKENVYEYNVIKSDKKGLYQHNILNWKIKEFKFKRVEEVNDFSKNIKNIIDDWLKKCSYHERELFINAFYEVTLNSDATRIQDLIKGKAQLKKMYEKIKGFDDNLKEEMILTLKFLKDTFQDDVLLYIKGKIPKKIKNIELKNKKKNT